MINSIVNWFKKLFGLDTEEIKTETLGSTGTYDSSSNVTSGITSTGLANRNKNVTTNSENEDNGDDGFLTSMAIAAATDSTMIGYMAGGNIMGAMLGDAMVDHNSTSTNDSDSSSSTDSSSSNTSDDSSSSSSDYNSSSDFSSSGSSDFGGGSDFGSGGGSDF